MQLPGTLIETEGALALRNHIFDEGSKLEEPLGLLGFRARALQLLLEIINGRGPVSGLAEAFAKQRARIHLRPILPQLQVHGNTRARLFRARNRAWALGRTRDLPDKPPQTPQTPQTPQAPKEKGGGSSPPFCLGV